MPGDKRLAVHVEDHPLDYADFEGEIPKGQYGGGEVIVWDRGRWEPEGDPVRGLKKGRLDFTLEGAKLKGAGTLVRMGAKRGEAGELAAHQGQRRGPPAARAIPTSSRKAASVISGRTVEDIAAGNRRGSRRQRQGRAPARPAAFPGFVRRRSPPLPKAPHGAGWVHEIKFDGYGCRPRSAAARRSS